MEDLRKRLDDILVGYTFDNRPVYLKELHITGALLALLKDAMKPNLVQTLEGNPVLIHGGPFANIAHGCNSVIATSLGLELSDFVVTEAGFGADLGAEKFLDIKCRKAAIKPDAVICVATIKALKYHGGMEKEEIKNENLVALEKGFKNLLRHVDNLKNKYGLNVIVAINKYRHDTKREIEFLRDKLAEHEIELSLVESWEKGGNGAIDLAEKIVEITEKECKLNYIYDLEDSIKNKINAIATKIYGAEGVEYSEESNKKIEEIEKLGYGNLPVCIAKTQYSFSDDPKNLECIETFNIHIKDIILKAGAEFIVVITGKIMTMPGLPKIPAAEQIDLDLDGNIVGIF